MDEKIKCEMKDSLRSFYFNTVKSALPNLNNRRKDRLMAIFYILFYIIVVVIGLTFMNAGFRLGLYVLFSVAFVINFFLPKDFFSTISCTGICTQEKIFDFTGEHEIKKIFMPAFLHIFGNLKWKKGVNEKSAEAYRFYKSLNIIPPLKFFTFDDMIYGEYKGINLKILEAKSAYFRAVFIEFEMNKNFEGHTFITENSVTNKVLKFDNSKFDEVSLEDVEFCEKYKVYSNNQIEARYILTTAFMQRFKNLKTAFEAKYMRAGFKDGKIVMVLKVEHDLFSMGSILKDTDNKTFTKLFDEIISVLELTEELKLNQNLGL